MLNSARYYPTHWLARRPGLKEAIRQAGLAALSGGVPAADEVLMTTLTDAAKQAGRSLLELLSEDWLAREMMAAQTIGQLQLDRRGGGGLVVEFLPALVEALRHSRTGEMQLSDLELPSSTCYLHFGEQADIRVNGRWPLEGVLIGSGSGNYRFLLVGRGHEDWLHPTVHEHYMLRMPLASCSGCSFEEAVDTAIAIDLADIETGRRRALESPLGAKSMPVFDRGVALHALNREAFKQALQLVGNALAYYTSYPDDKALEWQPDTPRSMQAKALRPGKEGERGASKLHSMGFVQAWLVGKVFELHTAAPETTPLGPGAVAGPRSAHWRTGHWRRQAHGPQMRLRKLIWVRPMRVLGHRTDEPAAVLAQPGVEGPSEA